ncbi:Leucine-specific-binding protein precursor [Delftia tsuruhatensis]|uniref:ABC transporter substrate-binding protein n=1 Tax=Delftia tsuruhatensis TaxID=180282 RepID=UPI001E7837B4|nr:ABC transporter substrate-binding protein [Delftia tsuruhatensis]CAB5675476.1 Leucine-specific-binding protein precursor [Delftia tsuruhatensis]CAC9692658.1 Leucine-specific-binding protein precursor [Delftia tsuruhatensis]
MHRPETAFSRRQFIAAGTAAAAAAWSGVARSQDSGGTIVLGQSCAMTGPAAQIGQPFHEGAKLYFEQLNAQGGVGRRNIELRVVDDGYEPERCVANTQRFLSDDVFALFGYVGTSTSMAALPLLQKARVPLFAPLTGADALRQPQLAHLVYNVRASYADETALMVRHLTGLGLKKVAVLHQNDAYGQSGFEGVKAALAAKGLEPVGAATVERNSANVAAAVKALVPLGADVIVQIVTWSASAAFVRAARQAGFGGQFYNVSFVGTQALAEALGKDAEGVVVTQVVPSPFQTSRQITREFLTAIQKGGGKLAASYSSLEGYLTARVFADALRQASSGGKPTRDGLVAALDGLHGQQVAGFPLVFKAQSTRQRFVELSMLTADGKVRV